MNKLTRSIRPNILWLGVAFFAALIVYTYAYYYQPLSETYSPYINNKVVELLTLIPAVAAAIFGTLIVNQFEKSEPPFRIWLMFTIGWWWWALGELSAFPYDILYPNGYPDFTFIDVCWLMGYFFFGLTLYYQFRLIYSAKKSRQSVLYLAYIGLGLAVAYGLTQLAISAGLGDGSAWWVVYLSIIYPVFDVVEGAAAIWLSLLFGRGALGRPWWGLIAFAITDSIAIFFWLGGDKWVSEKTYTALDLLSSIFYILGYMITALAFLAAYNLLQHGVVTKRKIPIEIEKPE